MNAKAMTIATRSKDRAGSVSALTSAAGSDREGVEVLLKRETGRPVLIGAGEKKGLPLLRVRARSHASVPEFDGEGRRPTSDLAVLNGSSRGGSS